MTDLIINYIAVDALCTVALIILADASWRNVLFSAHMKKKFSLAALIAMTVILAELGSIFFENINNVSRIPALITNIIGFSLSPVIAVTLSKAFSDEREKIRVALTIPVWINAILVISSPWTGLVFNVSTNVRYMRGPLFWVYVFAYLCSYTILIIGSIKAMKYYQCRTKSTFIMLLVFTAIGTTVQLLFPHVHASWLCITLSLVLFYAYFCVLTETQDVLTGLLNRNVYDRYANNLPSGAVGIVIVFDLDGFKKINDVYGHQWGDTCLRMVGGLIKDYFHKLGFCYRTGGDEFSVICKTTDVKQIESVLALFHKKVDEIRKTGNMLGGFSTISTGYSVFHGSGERFDAAVLSADAQMYRNKNNVNL